jgi:hypothetical protein
MSYRPICDTWMLCRGKTGYYGTFPAGFLERARYLLGVTIFDPVLHICGGKVKDYQSGPMKGKGLGPNDRTVDLDPDLNPDFLMDVRKIGTNPGDTFPYWTPAAVAETSFAPDQPEFKHINVGVHQVTVDEGVFSTHGGEDRRPWAASLIDRPYSEEDAENYKVGKAVLPDLNDLLKRALSVTRVGGRVGVLDYFFPRPPREGVTLVACIGVICGYGNRMRCFSVFERNAANPLEWNTKNVDPLAEATEDLFPEPTPALGPSPVKKKKKKKKRRAKTTKKKLIKKRTKKKLPF